MIESEIAILSSVSHPHVIQLEEVFDFAAEKYLIMEYVPVGGWLVGGWVAWLLRWLIGWLVCWLVVLLIGWLVCVWFALVGWLGCPFIPFIGP